MFEDMGKIFVKYWDLFLIKGVTATILLSLMTVFFGTVIGALLALVKISKIKPLKWLVNAIVEIIRGTPMLLQLYISTFLIPVIIPAMNELENKKILCISFTLILNSAAYVSEIIRSGIEAVDKGQTEAARSLGLNGTTTMIQVVLPQAVKNILPALGNEFITVIKETSLASTFYVGELMTQYHVIVGKTHNSLPILMIIGIIYFVLNFVLSKLLGVFERRMKAHA
ncbi:MAG: amino acid ABC transporter permease [Clostridia bacterium]|nr:amino acid ABC transporter permease [Clostridia bacterium]MBR3687254.1 amino acid ABC transporter permease [Clostridia bacterium]